MENKVLSIIVPSYNMEKYLDKCIQSIIIPSISLLDVLIINDGSKDSTADIAKGYADKYPSSIRVINKENGNYGSCINEGLRRAVGKYVKVLDADDSFNTNELELLVKHLYNDNRYDLVVSNYCIVDENDNISKEISFEWPIVFKTIPYKDVEESLCKSNFQMHAVTYLTENLKKIGYKQLQGISYTDQQWMFMPMSVVQNVCFSNLTVYRYLIGRSGQTVESDAYARNYKAIKLITEKMIEDYLSLPEKSKYHNYRLIRQLEFLYYICLIRRDDAETNDELSKFDNNLRQILPEFYSILSNTRLFKMPIFYIRQWRKGRHKRNNIVLSSIRILLKLRKIARKR